MEADFCDLIIDGIHRIAWIVSRILKKSHSSQADNEGAIPFTRSTIFKASSLPRVNEVSVSSFHRPPTTKNRHQS